MYEPIDEGVFTSIDEKLVNKSHQEVFGKKPNVRDEIIVKDDSYKPDCDYMFKNIKPQVQVGASETTYSINVVARNNYNNTLHFSFKGSNLTEKEIKRLILDEIKIEVTEIPTKPTMVFGFN